MDKRITQEREEVKVGKKKVISNEWKKNNSGKRKGSKIK